MSKGVIVIAETVSMSEPGGQGVDAAAIELDQLSIEAGGRLLLENASAVFPAGRVVLIVGSSGAGKSMLLRVLAGLVGPRDPVVRVRGTARVGRRAWYEAGMPAVGVVFQHFALFDELTPRDNVRLAADHRVTPSPHSAGPQVDALLDELRIPTDVPTGSLSGGQRQRLAVARALAQDAEVLLYDEPTSGLDAATARQVAALIRSTHAVHGKTAVVVTHDYPSLAPIADEIYLLDAATRQLRQVPQEQWAALDQQLQPVQHEPVVPPPASLSQAAARLAGAVRDALVATSRLLEAILMVPWQLLPRWSSARWGFRFFLHYLRLVAGPSAWAYLAVAGAIIGFVATYFTFRFLPYANYTKPLLIEDLLTSMGFALYRILVPVLATILVAARCGAAVSSDLGGKSYGQQIDALKTFGIRPERYLCTAVLYAFLLGTPLLNAISFAVARTTSLIVFAVTHPERGAEFWRLHFHRQLIEPGQWLYRGTGWLLAKTLLCAVGIALVAYGQALRPQASGHAVSRSITRTILWATLWVLVVHFAFAFVEFDANS